MSAIQQFVESVTVGTPVEAGRLTMVPILGGSAEPAPHVILDEALAAGTLTISEVSEQGDVPELALVNDGQAAVFLLDGETLVGAKQDRVVNLSILAPPHARMRIPVSCVERGRWTWQSRNLSTSGSSLFARARRGKMRSVSDSLRGRAAHSSDQHEVWRDVQHVSHSIGSRSATGAMEDAYRQRQQDLNALERQLASLPGQCGAAFLVDGRLVGLDIFSHQSTARALHAKLVRSYALEAILPGPGVPPSLSSQALAARFLSAIGASASEEHPALGLGRDIRIGGADVVAAALVHDEAVVHLAAYAGSL